MTWNNIDDFKKQLNNEGFTTKAILTDTDFEKIVCMLNNEKGVIKTPNEEIKYIEGLYHLPLGYLKYFHIITDNRETTCSCGRNISALDIVHFAYKHQVHSTNVIRDAFIGFNNLFEIAENGRTGECYGCGKPITVLSYWANRYMYA